MIYSSNVIREEPLFLKETPIHRTCHKLELGEHKHHVFMFELEKKSRLQYRAFCSGNIIAEQRVLSSAHCFLTSRKRYKHRLSNIRVVAGVLRTRISKMDKGNTQQWRRIERLYTQKYFRFPAYNLAVLQLDKPWIYNHYVSNIPYASLNQNFDGVCCVTTVKPTESWSSSKSLYSEEFGMLTRKQCENNLLRSCRLFHCTAYDTRKLLLDAGESEGSGLICHRTNDPEELDEDQGVLVGITSLIYIRLPTLHHKIGPFHKWVTDSCSKNVNFSLIVMFCLFIKWLIYVCVFVHENGYYRNL